MRINNNLKQIKHIDKTILFSVLALVIFGIINIYLATHTEYGYSYIIKQSIWVGVCLVVMYLIVSIENNMLMAYAPIFYWISVALLILTLIVGKAVNGAIGWITLGPISFQASEFAKIATIMMLGKKLEEMNGTINEWKNFFIIAFYAAIPAGLIVVEPDMGMTMVLFFIVLGILFIAGLDIKIIGGGLLSLVLAIVIVWNSGLIQPYQKSRITSFTHPESDTSQSGYHLKQSLIGIGNGGVLGVNGAGLKKSATAYSPQYVPEVETDFIFASLAEQWGMVGAIFLLILYGILISKMIAIGRTAKNTFGTVICIGLVSYFLFALLQNIGMTIGLMAITGITLPLISYGGSSLLTTVLSISLVLNVGVTRKKSYF